MSSRSSSSSRMVKAIRALELSGPEAVPLSPFSLLRNGSSWGGGNYCLVEAGHTILVHAAAGGVGSLLCQWANALGATISGTVSAKEKAIQAKEYGCHHVIIYKEEDFLLTRVNDNIRAKALACNESHSQSVWLTRGSLDCLKLVGYIVSFGQSSGKPDPLPLSAIAVKSLFLTRPSLVQYIVTREELLEASEELFANIVSGVLYVHVSHKYPPLQAAEAHADLEDRRTTGSIMLTPDASF
ncbi:hypothetical protein Cgig2_033844 [Carnegiea gigantea]|uniref:Alcohol dehydrogenase-like C-terminal domain-containing protein n=1 Tax=Carnegiea gigantea TaxID=171969 RepID=A0A9Q1GU50_9CARY|nr:hypothetical protein Cgig2_033844 [Carnegiea gigantea]